MSEEQKGNIIIYQSDNAVIPRLTFALRMRMYGFRSNKWQSFINHQEQMW